MTDDARTMDFLEGGGPLPIDWQAPEVSAASIAASKSARASFDAAVQNQKIHDDGDRLAMANAIVYAQLNYDHAVQAVYDHIFQEYQKKYLSGTDWGLLPAALKVIIAAVSTAATGGFAAPSVALLFKSLKGALPHMTELDASYFQKKIDEAKSVLDAYHAVDDTIDQNVDDAKAALEKIKKMTADATMAFTVPDVQGDDLGAVQVAADRLLSDPSVTNAHQVLINTQALAATGNPDAQRAVAILSQVAAARVSNRVPFGQPLMPVHTVEQAALVAHIVPQTVYRMTGDDIAAVSAGRQSLWKRFVTWLENLV